MSLTINVQLSGASIDFWTLDPVALFFGSVGISSQAPHPQAALLAANFLLSREAQELLTQRGRLPTRPDVPVNPAYVSDRLKDRKIIATIFGGQEQKKWQGLFKDIFRPK
jgi:ABC-type Fe3+ transport system substrate-binding protein